MAIEILWIKEKVKEHEYEFSAHADNERQSDKISVAEVENALLQGELLEHYPDDPRGSSCLILGYGNEGYPIHIVCGKTLLGTMRIITVYTPALPKWVNPRTRRNEK